MGHQGAGAEARDLRVGACARDAGWTYRMRLQRGAKLLDARPSHTASHHVKYPALAGLPCDICVHFSFLFLPSLTPVPLVINTVAEALGLPETAIHDELEYKSIAQWDSFGHVSLMLALERTFGVSIGSSKVLALTSVRAIRTFLESSDAERSSLAFAHKLQNVPISVERGRSEAEVERRLGRVFFEETEITKIDIPRADILYRGYSLHELAEHSSFEETAFLLLMGRLPTFTELKSFDSELRLARSLPPEILKLLELLKSMHPLHALRSAISALPAFQEHVNACSSRVANEIRLIAQIPMIVSAHHRIRSGLPVVSPNMSMTHAQNFLYMLFDRHPSRLDAWYVDKDLILHADHSSTPSTFAARVATGTNTDLHSAVTAAIATFGGELHGLAPERITEFLEQIGSPEHAREHVSRKLAARSPIPGFGHRIYRIEDPRARHLRAAARLLGREKGDVRLLAIADAVVEAMSPYARHGIAVNDDLYSCIAFRSIGIPGDLLASVAITSRIVGLTAHICEQRTNIAPIAASLKYTGRVRSTYIPIEHRE